VAVRNRCRRDAWRPAPAAAMPHASSSIGAPARLPRSRDSGTSSRSGHASWQVLEAGGCAHRSPAGLDYGGGSLHTV
jgi:hypothetical protein